MQRPDVLPPPPPSAPAPTPQVQVKVNGLPFNQDPTAVLKAAEAARRELGNQLDNLQERRNTLSERLQDPMVKGADKTGLETRISEIDARISAVDKQIAAADAEVAKAAGVPGAYVEPPPFERSGPPEEAFVLTGIFFVVVLMPLSVAYARRIWRRGVATVSTLPQEVMDRLTRLDQAVDSIAVEVERIGEGQRFMTRLFASKGTPEALLSAAREGSADSGLSEGKVR
jgi:tetrahydromethanopterin S-methyltransferase subunit G